MKKEVKKTRGNESPYTRQLGNKTVRQDKRASRTKGRAVKQMSKAVTKGKSTKRATKTDVKAKKVLDKAAATYKKYIKNKKMDAKEMGEYNKKKGSTAIGGISKKGRKRLNKKT